MVKTIEGVEKVDNQIEGLPVSPNDDWLRLKIFRAIYGFNALQRYALPVVKPDPDHCEEWARDSGRYC